MFHDVPSDVTTETLHDVGHNVGHSDLFSFPEIEQLQYYNNKQACSKKSRSKHHDLDLKGHSCQDVLRHFYFRGGGGV